MSERLLTLATVAQQLGVSVRQVRRHVDAAFDPLPVVQLGPRSRRVSPTDLEAWVNRRRGTHPAPSPGLFSGFSEDARNALEQLCNAPEMHPSGRKSATTHV
jgi:excisionase family DNA binding protein